MYKSKYQTVLGTYVSLHRHMMGLSQSEYGKKYGVNYGTVSRWERGVYPPKAEVLDSIIIMAYADGRRDERLNISNEKLVKYHTLHKKLQT